MSLRRPLSGFFFERVAQRATMWAGSSLAFGLALASIILWASLGFLFHFSDTWQLVINTATTIITFLMVFLVQRSQNKDALAIHLKLNEIVAAMKGASNCMINVENLSEAEVKLLHSQYEKLLELEEANSTRSLSIDVSLARQQHESEMGNVHKRAGEGR
jgi:low affinity Fe/Cu permease